MKTYIWNVITTKGTYEMKYKKDVSCDDVALSFSLKYCGEKGRVLEIRYIDEEEI